MKKIIILTFLTQTLLSCAQTYPIYPLNSPEAPSGAYIKDIDNEFTPYLGTWEGTWDNKKITFYLNKLEHKIVETLVGFKYRDVVIAQYKVIDLATGIIIEDSTTTTDFNSIDLQATTINRNKNFLPFFYDGGLSKCGLSADVFMYRDLTNPNILKYKYYVNGGLEQWRDGHCSYTDLNQIAYLFQK